MEARQYERVDELRAIMAGLDYEDSFTSVAQEIQGKTAAERAGVACGDLVDALQDLTLGETNDETRREFSSLWTDAIIMLGDLRRMTTVEGI